MAALQPNLVLCYESLKNFLCGLDKGPIIKVCKYELLCEIMCDEYSEPRCQKIVIEFE